MATTVDQLGLDLGAGLTTLLRRYYVDLMRAAHDDAAAVLEFDAAFDVELPEVQDVLGRLAWWVRDITETTRMQVQALVGQAAAEGWSDGRLADEILKLGEVQSRRRARTIAITEATRGYSAGSLLAYQRSGVVGKVEWLTAADDACPVCRPLNGKTVGLGQEFAPGIPHPPAHPACRCAILPVVDPLGAEEPAPGEAETPAQVQRRLVRAREDAIRPQRFESAYAVAEDGEVLLEKDGGHTYVDFSADELRALRGRGVTFTHNHPLGWEVPASDPRRMGNSFSDADIDVACDAQVAEIRAVTPTRRYWMRPPPEGWNEEYWRTVLRPTYLAYNDMVRREFMREIRRGTMTTQEAEAQHNHEVWSRVTKELDIPYGYEED